MAPEQPEATAAVQGSALSDLLTQQPARVLRFLLYGLLLLTAACLLVSAFWSLDVPVTAPAVLFPDGRTVLIQPETPVTVRRILVKEGDAVAEGAPLAELESDEVEKQLHELAAATADVADARAEVQRLVPLQQEQLEQERRRLEEQARFHRRSVELLDTKAEATDRDYRAGLARLEEKRQRLRFNRETAEAIMGFRKADLASLEKLHVERVTSELELLAAQRNLVEAEGLVANVRSQEKELAQDREQLETTYRKATLDLQTELQKHRFEAEDAEAHARQLPDQARIRSLEATKKLDLATQKQALARQKVDLQLRGLNAGLAESVLRGEQPLSNRLQLLAPMAGRIGFVPAHSRGETVGRGQTLLSVLPLGAPLLVEVRVPNKEAGRVQVGQQVKLRFDAFPFGDFGILTGEIRTLAGEAETPVAAAGGEPAAGAEPFFRAVASLDQPYFRRKDRIYELRPGMTATAEIVTERRTLLQILLRPLYELEP